MDASRLIRVLATLFVAIQLVGHANGTFIEGLGTDSAKPDPLAGLKCLLGSYTGVSEGNCPPPAPPPSRTDVPPSPSPPGQASSPPAVNPSSPLQPAPSQSPSAGSAPQQSPGPQAPGTGSNAPAVSPPNPAYGPGVPTSGPAIPAPGPGMLPSAPSEAPATSPVPAPAPAIQPPPPPLPVCAQYQANSALSNGVYNSFGFNTDTATIGQLFTPPPACVGRPIQKFYVFWPSTAVVFPAGRGYVYEFNTVTRQVVGSPLVDVAAVFYNNVVTMDFPNLLLQAATQYVFIVTTSGSWNGGAALTKAISTVDLATPLGTYTGALQGAVTLDSGNSLSLVSSGTYTLQLFNLYIEMDYA